MEVEVSYGTFSRHTGENSRIKVLPDFIQI